MDRRARYPLLRPSASGRGKVTLLNFAAVAYIQTWHRINQASSRFRCAPTSGPPWRCFIVAVRALHSDPGESFSLSLGHEWLHVDEDVSISSSGHIQPPFESDPKINVLVSRPPVARTPAMWWMPPSSSPATRLCSPPHAPLTSPSSRAGSAAALPNRSSILFGRKGRVIDRSSCPPRFYSNHKKKTQVGGEGGGGQPKGGRPPYSPSGFLGSQF